jgi:hypothetical protein
MEQVRQPVMQALGVAVAAAGLHGAPVLRFDRDPGAAVEDDLAPPAGPAFQAGAHGGWDGRAAAGLPEWGMPV